MSAALCVAAVSCGSGQRRADARAADTFGPTSRIQERTLSDRPPLSIIERQGDPEAAIGFASLAAGSAELHAGLGELLRERLSRSGFQAQLVAHGVGFELTLLAENNERAGIAAQTLLQALTKPIAAAELASAGSKSEPDRTPASAVAQCSAELTARRRITDPTELERERVATFAQDRAAISVVGERAAASGVADALAAGPDWPELGAVRARLPERSVTQVVRNERATLSVALTLSDPNRALGAALRLGEANAALGIRLAALGGGLRLRRVAAVAHPSGACLRIDSDVDASPLPEPRHLGFAIHLIEEEASLAISASNDENRLEATAISAADPRAAARAAAYRALIEPAGTLPSARLVALATPEEGPLAPSIDLAIQQARRETSSLDTQLRVEAGQHGIWALLSTPCATLNERSENAGHAAVFLAAASAGASHGARLEPWIGAGGVGLLGFVERTPGESDAQAAARLGDALGQAMLAPPSAVDVASARAELLKQAGTEPHPLLESLLDALAPGHLGALAPRGNARSLQAASREAVLVRQRELLRLPQRLAILSPSNPADAAQVSKSLARWLRTPDAARASPCGGDVSPPARGDLSLAPGVEASEPSYVAFRIPAKAGAEASLLAELLNLPGGALERTLAEPDLAGAARALVFGSSAARALVIQLSAFPGREEEVLARIQKFLERLAAGGVLGAPELEAAVTRQRVAHRVAALDPRYRLVQLLEPTSTTPPDTAALRRLAASLRPDSAIVARSVGRSVSPVNGKTPPAR